jgi:outer membrane receptor protein involved in Fe transport
MPHTCIVKNTKVALTIAAGFLFLFTITLLAGTTGKISGVIKDEESGELLAGATIVVKGSNRGAAADINGEYFINNVPPGLYTLEISILGYTNLTINNVRVSIDQTTVINATLKKSSVEMQTVVIRAERPLIEPNVTNKTVSISSEDIKDLPVISMQDILNMQAGVVQVEGRFNKIPGFEDRGIDQTHVRGGRNGEIAYMVDGMYVEDAIYAGMGTFVNRGAVEEMKVEVGGFNAEYGEAQSGVVNIVTKEAGSMVGGSLETSTGEWGNLHLSGYQPLSLPDDLRDFHNLLGTISLPFPEIPELSLFLAGEQTFRRYQVLEFDNIVYDPTSITDPTNRYYGDSVGDTLMIFSAGKMRLAHPYDRYAGWRAFGFYKSFDYNIKLTYRPSSLIKVNLIFRTTDRRFRNYAYNWQYAQNAQHITTDLTDQEGLTFRHQITPSTFYTLNVNRFWKSRTYKIPGLVGDVLGPGLHTQDFNHNGVGAPQDPNELWHYDPSSPDYPNQSSTGQFYDPLTIIGYDSTRGVNVYSGGTTQYWTQNFQQSMGAKFDITSQITKNNELKAGMEVRMLDIYFRELQYPWLETPFSENYLHHPREASMYFQDQLDLGRVILNLGGRVDYARSGGRIWADPKDPTSVFTDANPKFQFSPRLGFGYRITEATTFHFNYGHFFQIPEYRNLYLGSTLDLTIRPIIGNPSLSAQKTISYEFGAKHQFSDYLAVDVTAWTKSLTGQTGAINIQGFDPDSLGAYNYYIFDNYDYGTAKGIDFTVEKRFNNNYGLSLNYTYSVAKANRYYSWTGYWNSETAETEPKLEILMPYDQTHKLDANLYLKFEEGFGPEVLGIKLLERWFFNFIFTYQSGYPYTPVVGSKVGDPMSARSPARSQVDATFRREFTLMKDVTFGVFARVINLFDQKNILYVYPATGSATQPDPASGGYSTYFNRPDFFDVRRQIDLGVRLDF